MCAVSGVVVSQVTHQKRRSTVVGNIRFYAQDSEARLKIGSVHQTENGK